MSICSQSTAKVELVILSENQKADEPYMVCYCKWDNLLGINEYYNVCVTDDYVEALNLYANGILSFTQILEKQFVDYEQPPKVLTAADCVPNGLDYDLTGSLIVIKPEALAPEYRRTEHQLKHCKGGFGASPNSRGNAVFCKDLNSGKESRFERYDVAGVIDPTKMPEWAKKKLTLPEKQQIKPTQTPQSKQPPSLLGEVREAAHIVEQRKTEGDSRPQRGNTHATKKRETTEL